MPTHMLCSVVIAMLAMVFGAFGGAEFDDCTWEVIDPTTLTQRRSTGRLSFNWYRIKVTIPERIGSVDPRGSTVVFETIVDDYAGVWVDGELPRGLGQRGGSVSSGWNAPNRPVIAPKRIHNMTWGDEDGKALYLCARSGLYRVQLNIAGILPAGSDS